MFKQFCILAVLLLCAYQAQSNEHDLELAFFEFIQKFEPLVYKYLHAEADFLRILEKLHIYTPAQICSKCHEHYKAKQEKYTTKDNFFYKEAEKLGDDACKLKLDSAVCDGVVPKYYPRFVHNYIYHFFDPDFQCGSQGFCTNYEKLSVESFKERVLADMPTPQKTPIKDQSRYKILHLTDTHMELNYEVGSEAKCSRPYCCTKDDGTASSEQTAAGKWGSFKGQCDLPSKSTEESIKYIGQVLKPDIVVWSGDSFGHVVWKQTKEGNLDSMRMVTNWIDQYIVQQGITVYPIWGNHEAYPISEFDYYGNDTTFLKDGAYEMWNKWLPTEALDSIKAHGYYSMKNEKHKFKIITLLTEVYDVVDFHLLPNPTDPLNQLVWLENELKEAEESGYPVIITGHIPNNAQTTQSEWQIRFNILCERYQNIIRAQFYGHSHVDSFNVLHGQAKKEPIGLSFLTPSLTGGITYPSLRIYEFDSETSALLNGITYRCDIEKANSENAASLQSYWFKAYDFVSYYNFSDYMTIDKMANMINNLETNEALMKNYLFNFYQNHKSLTEIDSLLKNDKDGYFKKMRFCETRYSIHNEVFACQGAAATTEPVSEFYDYFQDLTSTWYKIKSSTEEQNTQKE